MTGDQNRIESSVKLPYGDCVVFKVAGGIGNICGGLVSAVLLARRYGGKKCIIHWNHKMPLVRTGLSGLFDFSDMAKAGFPVPIHQKGGNDALWKEYKDLEIGARLGSCHVACLGGKTEFVPTHHIDKGQVAAARECWKRLKPSARIAIDASQFETRHFARPVLGIHSRNTDNPKSVRLSPLAAFFSAIDPIADSFNTIFLATDDPFIERRFLSRYGKKVVFTAKPDAKRWGGFTMRKKYVTISHYSEAMLDVVLLGRCDRLLGSCGSTFSKAAARMSANPSLRLEVVISRTLLPPP